MSPLLRVLLALATLAALVLLAAVTSSSAWLWLLLAAAALLVVYARSGAYAALLVGGLLAGAAVGTLLEVAFRWQGSFLVSVGAAALTVEGLESRPGHWPFVFGVAFLLVGAVVTLVQFGPRGYLAASLAAAAVTVAVTVLRRR